MATDERSYFVTEAPRRGHGRLHHSSTVRACLAWIRTRTTAGASRLAVWAATPPPSDGPDVALCLPLAVFEAWREHAVAVVDRWDTAWLLIESVAPPHQGEARDALVEAIAGALAVAAAQGVDDQIDLDF